MILMCPLAECGGQAGVIRLFNGSTTSEGEVQYCSNSMWTPVWGDTWGVREAAVACRQLGFAGEGIDTGSVPNQHVVCLIASGARTCSIDQCS